MTRSTRLLTHADVARLSDMRLAMRVVADAFRAQARGEVTMPPKVYLPLSDGSDFRAMPAALRRPPVCGVKWVNVHPKNRIKGLPTVMGTIIINEATTGFPLAVLDGSLVTRLRTGAAAGVAARVLARRVSTTVGLVGCGAQALWQVAALMPSFPLRRVRVWGLRPGEARRFCDAARRRLRVRWEPVRTVRTCVEDADIIVTVTPARGPLVRRAWVKPGAHLNAIGADAPGKQELDPQILRHATVVVDDVEQAIHGGELNVAIRQRLVDRRVIHATLGDILLGRARGRTEAHELTVFDSTGVAVHDVALAYAIFRRAVRTKVGRTLHLVLS